MHVVPRCIENNAEKNFTQKIVGWGVRGEIKKKKK